MEYIYIGKITNTHGIKGEIRIISDFKYKEAIFKKNFKVYIGNKKEEHVINTYRFHKIYDMITLNDINDINDVLKYKGKNIYINKDDLKIEGYLDEDLINLDVFIKNKYLGVITDVEKTKAHSILIIEKDSKRCMVPNIDVFIEKISFEDNKLYLKNEEGLIYEN